MSDPIVVGLIAMAGGAIIGPLVTKLMNRRKDRIDAEGGTAALWQEWSSELKARVAALEEDVSELKRALAHEEDTNRELRSQIDHQKQLLRSLVRWAITMRDEVLRAGGHVPPTPVDVESALTTLDHDTTQ